MMDHEEVAFASEDLSYAVLKVAEIVRDPNAADLVIKLQEARDFFGGCYKALLPFSDALTRACNRANLLQNRSSRPNAHADGIYIVSEFLHSCTLVVDRKAFSEFKCLTRGENYLDPVQKVCRGCCFRDSLLLKHVQKIRDWQNEVDPKRRKRFADFVTKVSIEIDHERAFLELPSVPPTPKRVTLAEFADAIGSKLKTLQNRPAETGVRMPKPVIPARGNRPAVFELPALEKWGRIVVPRCFIGVNEAAPEQTD